MSVLIDPQLHLVAVYGTLRRGQSNHHLMQGCAMLGQETLAGFCMYDLGPYPAAIPAAGQIVCELYQVNTAQLHQLDQLEDVPREYRREQVATGLGSAFIYLYQDSEGLQQHPQLEDWLLR